MVCIVMKCFDVNVFCIIIVDQGQGVLENELEVIFQLFFCGEVSLLGGGYGLGLVIVCCVIIVVGGWIGVRKVVGNGLVVDIELLLVDR